MCFCICQFVQISPNYLIGVARFVIIDGRIFTSVALLVIDPLTVDGLSDQS